MRKLIVSALAAGTIAGGALAGSALASSSHSTASGKTSSVELRTDRAGSSSAETHLERSQPHSDRSSLDR